MVLACLLGLIYPIVEARIFEKKEALGAVEDFQKNFDLEEGDSSQVSVFEAENPTIGVIYVPSADITLPIYEGLSEYALSSGVGTMPGASDLSGDLGTHSALSSHAGLSANGLFTNLTRVVEGDNFYIQNMEGDILKYRVVETASVLPTESERLARDPARSLSTLITCESITGINSHRFLALGDLEEIMDPALLEDELTGGGLVLSSYEIFVLFFFLNNPSHPYKLFSL